MNFEITEVGCQEFDRWLGGFVALLRDSVDQGASVGFLPPLADEEARAYWRSVEQAVCDGGRILLCAHRGDEVVGSVQLDLAHMPNGRHRAEVMKLLVLSRERRQGVGRALMQAAEDAARLRGRTLLVLDTRKGDAAEALYRSIGYTEAGVVPGYARGADGELHDTVFFYREIPGASDRR